MDIKDKVRRVIKEWKLAVEAANRAKDGLKRREQEQTEAVKQLCRVIRLTGKDAVLFGGHEYIVNEDGALSVKPANVFVLPGGENGHTE